MGEVYLARDPKINRDVAIKVLPAAFSENLWVREIDSLTAKPLEGTDDPIYPFWSPDSRFIGFFSHDGKELFYISADRKLMAVEVKSDGPVFQSSVPKTLFELRVRGLAGPRNYYVVSNDGQRFLVASTPEEAATRPVTVVLNWQSDVKR
jgi:hypothetical protein